MVFFLNLSIFFVIFGFVGAIFEEPNKNGTCREPFKNLDRISNFRDGTGFVFVWDLTLKKKILKSQTEFFVDIFCFLPKNLEIFGIFIGKKIFEIQKSIVGAKFPFYKKWQHLKEKENDENLENYAKQKMPQFPCNLFLNALQIFVKQKNESTSNLLEFLVAQFSNGKHDLQNPENCKNDYDHFFSESKTSKPTAVLNFLNFGLRSNVSKISEGSYMDFIPGDTVFVELSTINFPEKFERKLNFFVGKMAKISQKIMFRAAKDDNKIAKILHKNSEEFNNSELSEITLSTSETPEYNGDENFEAKLEQFETENHDAVENISNGILQPKKFIDGIEWIPWIANGIAISILLAVVVRTVRDPNFWADRQLHKLEEADHRDTIPLQPIKEENENESILNPDPIPSTSESVLAASEANPASETNGTPKMPRSSIEIDEDDLQL